MRFEPFNKQAEPSCAERSVISSRSASKSGRSAVGDQRAARSETFNVIAPRRADRAAISRGAGKTVRRDPSFSQSRQAGAGWRRCQRASICARRFRPAPTDWSDLSFSSEAICSGRTSPEVRRATAVGGGVTMPSIRRDAQDEGFERFRRHLDRPAFGPDDLPIRQDQARQAAPCRHAKRREASARARPRPAPQPLPPTAASACRSATRPSAGRPAPRPSTPSPRPSSRHPPFRVRRQGARTASTTARAVARRPAGRRMRPTTPTLRGREIHECLRGLAVDLGAKQFVGRAKMRRRPVAPDRAVRFARCTSQWTIEADVFAGTRSVQVACQRWLVFEPLRRGLLSDRGSVSSINTAGFLLADSCMKSTPASSFASWFSASGRPSSPRCSGCSPSAKLRAHQNLDRLRRVRRIRQRPRQTEPRLARDQSTRPASPPSRLLSLAGAPDSVQGKFPLTPSQNPCHRPPARPPNRMRQPALRHAHSGRPTHRRATPTAPVLVSDAAEPPRHRLHFLHLVASAAAGTAWGGASAPKTGAPPPIDRIATQRGH